MIKTIILKLIVCLFFTFVLSCANAFNLPSFPYKSEERKSNIADSQLNAVDEETLDTWDKIQRISSLKLAALSTKETNYTQKAWLELALISKRYSLQTEKLISELMQWRKNYPTHPANKLFPKNSILIPLSNERGPQHFAILLPQKGNYNSSAKAIREGFLNKYYSTPGSIKPVIRFYDTSKEEDIFTIYQKAINEGADFILGPLTKENVQEISQVNSNVPTLALNYTHKNSTKLPIHHYEFGLAPEDEALQMAYRAHQSGLSKALLIAPSNEWGNRLTSNFMSYWQAFGGSILDSWNFGSRLSFNLEVAHLLHVNSQIDRKLMRKDNKKQTLAQQRRQDFDVIFLFAPAEDARLIVPLLRFYYAGDIPIYTGSAVYSGKTHAEKNKDLTGIIVCDIPRKQSIHPSPNRFFAVGEDAYLLSQSLHRLMLMPHFPLYANTGALFLTENQQIRRRIPCLAVKHDNV